MKAKLLLFFTAIALACAHGEGPEKEPGFVHRILSIRIPKIRIESATVGESFAFVGRKVLDNDPEPEPADRGISFIAKGPFPPGERTVHYTRENIAVDVLLQDLVDLYEVQIHVTSVGIFVTPIGTPPFPNSKAEAGKTYKTYTPKAPKSKIRYEKNDLDRPSLLEPGEPKSSPSDRPSVKISGSIQLRMNLVDQGSGDRRR